MKNFVQFIQSVYVVKLFVLLGLSTYYSFKHDVEIDIQTLSSNYSLQLSFSALQLLLAASRDNWPANCFATVAN